MKLKFKNGKFLLFLLVFLISLFSCFFPDYFIERGKLVNYEEEGIELSFHVIDIGQGSASLIKTENKTVLIDTGESYESKKLIDYLKGENVKDIDLAVVTHPHSDHFGAMSEVLKEFKVKKLMLPKMQSFHVPNVNSWLCMEKEIYKKDIPFYYPGEKEIIPLGENSFMELLGPFIIDTDNLNELSLCFKVICGNTSFLITGDGERLVEKALLSEDIDSDVYIAGHHGSDTSSSPEFLKKVSPKYSAVSVGFDNLHNLPDENIIRRLSSYGKVFRTDKDGSLVFTSDGHNIKAYKEN